MQERTLCAMLSPGPPRASRTRCAPTALRRVLRGPLQPRCHAPSPLPQGGRGCPKGGRGSAFIQSPSASPSSRNDGERSPRLQPHRYRISRDAGAHPVRDAVARPTKSIAHKVRSYGSAPGVAGAASAAMPRTIPSPARRERVPEGRERVRFHAVTQREPLKQERRRAFAAPAAATGTGFRVMQERTLCAMLLPGPPRASRTRCATGPRRESRRSSLIPPRRDRVTSTCRQASIKRRVGSGQGTVWRWQRALRGGTRFAFVGMPHSLGIPVEDADRGFHGRDG